MKKKFDIEKAKQGAKIITRDGRPVEILKYNYNRSGSQRIVVCSKDEDGDDMAYVVHLDGSWIYGMENNADIFLEVESTYRPYANIEELDAAIKEHGFLVVNKSYQQIPKDQRILIGRYNKNEIVLTNSTHWRYETFFENFEWIDGTPCGVQE